MGEGQSYIKKEKLDTIDPDVVDKWGDPTKHPETQLSQEQIDRLIGKGREMFISHLTKDGFPIVTIHLYCMLDGAMWSTTVRGRAKERAYRRDPRCAMCISTTGLKLGFGGGICIKAHAEVVEDCEIVERVCRGQSRRYYGEEQAQEMLFKLLFTPNRLAIRFEPLKTISWMNIGMKQKK